MEATAVVAVVDRDPGERLPLLGEAAATAAGLVGEATAVALALPGRETTTAVRDGERGSSGGAPGSSIWKAWPARSPRGTSTSYSLP